MCVLVNECDVSMKLWIMDSWHGERLHGVKCCLLLQNVMHGGDAVSGTTVLPHLTVLTWTESVGLRARSIYSRGKWVRAMQDFVSGE